MKPAIDLICPECGESSVYRGGTAYWCPLSQSWELSGDLEPEHYCGECGASGIEPVEVPYKSERQP